MYRKNALAFLVCTVFLVSMLVGCSQNSNSESNDVTLNDSSSKNNLTISSAETSSTQSMVEDVEFNFDTYANLDNWIGTYEYIDGIPQEVNGQYSLAIHKAIHYQGTSRALYYAELSASGRMLNLNIFAIVQGTDDKIFVVFYDYFPEGKDALTNSFIRGDTLLVLKKNESGIITELSESMAWADGLNFQLVK